MKKNFLKYLETTYGSLNTVPPDVYKQLLGSYLAGVKAAKLKLKDGGFEALEQELILMTHEL